jgi:cell wall-associated NlpC family hydrolase
MTLEAASPDRRRHAWRDDLAAEALRGVVSATRYTVGVRHQVVAAIAPVRRAPSGDTALDTEALRGEVVTVYDVADGWAWGQLERDRYVGYLQLAALDARIVPPTHKVSVPATFVYPAADIKRPPLAMLPLGASVEVAAIEGRFAELRSGGFVYAPHLTPIGALVADCVAIAEQLIGTPYLWGGKSRVGIDCSGLVQVSLQTAGIDAPRDSDMQAAEVGEPLNVRADLQGLARGDLVCWNGHIGIMADANLLLHANAYHMNVAREPLVQAVARIAMDGSQPTGFRRPPATA